MGLLLDVVPNHMGAGYEATGTNLWWRIVLENGRASEYANFFDIDWNPLKAELRNKVLLPILGNQYGEELEAGRIVLAYDARPSALSISTRFFPSIPQTIPLIFHTRASCSAGDAARELLALLAALAELPPHTCGPSCLPAAARGSLSAAPLYRAGGALQRVRAHMFGARAAAQRNPRRCPQLRCAARVAGGAGLSPGALASLCRRDQLPPLL